MHTNCSLEPIYLDANATTAQLPEVIAAVSQAAALGPTNASSAHSLGDRAREMISQTREVLCKALGVDDEDGILFVSGGTEANNIVVNGFGKLPEALMLCSATEHASVLETVLNHGGRVIPVDADGVIDNSALYTELQAAARRPVLVSVQAANSETGVIQPLADIIDVCRGAPGEVYLHVDAAQAFGRMTIFIDGIDALTTSGHKLHAPLGSGFVYLSDRLADILPRTILGGGQERGFRSGTVNVPAIAGLKVAVETRFSDLPAAMAEMKQARDAFETRLLQLVPAAKVIGATAKRLPNTTNVMFPGQEAMALMARLDAAGVVCSNGSACSSMKPSASPVLRAMGLSEREALACLRFSFSVSNTSMEALTAAEIVAATVGAPE